MPLSVINIPRRSKMDIFFFGGSGGLERVFWTSWKGGVIFFSSWFTFPLYGQVLLVISDAGGIWRFGPK